MAETSTLLLLSFTTTNGRDCPDSIRLKIATAIQSAGAEIDLKTPIGEGDRVFYGLLDGVLFTVAIAEMPNYCIVSMEGSRAEETVDPTISTWAYPIIESTVRACDGTSNIRWHESNQALREAFGE